MFMGIFRRKSEDRTIPKLPALPGSAVQWWWYRPGQSHDATLRPEGALGNPDVYAATRVLCDAAATCPLLVYRRQADGERRRAQGRTADLLNAPSEGTTQASFVATALSHLLLWGNCYLGKYRDDDGQGCAAAADPP
jgi:phage portal protein BeeE